MSCWCGWIGVIPRPGDNHREDLDGGSGKRLGRQRYWWGCQVRPGRRAGEGVRWGGWLMQVNLTWQPGSWWGEASCVSRTLLPHGWTERLSISVCPAAQFSKEALCCAPSLHPHLVLRHLICFDLPPIVLNADEIWAGWSDFRHSVSCNLELSVLIRHSRRRRKRI